MLVTIEIPAYINVNIAIFFNDCIISCGFTLLNINTQPISNPTIAVTTTPPNAAFPAFLPIGIRIRSVTNATTANIPASFNNAVNPLSISLLFIAVNVLTAYIPPETTAAITANPNNVVTNPKLAIVPVIIAVEVDRVRINIEIPCSDFSACARLFLTSLSASSSINFFTEYKVNHRTPNPIVTGIIPANLVIRAITAIIPTAMLITYPILCNILLAFLTSLSFMPLISSIIVFFMNLIEK